jgi:Holliday junction resolvase RusA-like endonuclease
VTTVVESIVITALGQPKPKGSLRHVGKGRLVEQIKDGPAWRTTVKDAAVTTHRAYWAARQFRPAGLERAPFDGPVTVEVTVTVTKPKSAPKTRPTWPVTRSSGDIDKHARNILDALVDAGVLHDDSQVIDCHLRKLYPGQHPDTLTTPGVVIRLSTVEETT